jgi:hypothetical protein
MMILLIVLGSALFVVVLVLLFQGPLWDLLMLAPHYGLPGDG